MFRKQVIYIVVVFISSLFYVSCQKELTGTSPADNPVPSDSTDTNIDSLTILSFSPDSGRTGTLITITGSGFDVISIGNTVAINGTAAEVFNSSATALVVQVGEGTTTGKISITAYGKTAVSSKAFVVLADTASAGDKWVRKADVPSGTYTFVSGFSIHGKGYFFDGGGLRMYDPVSGTWNVKRSLPSTNWHRYGFCFVIGEKAYVGLGAGAPGMMYTEAGKNYRDVWEYNAMRDTWTQKSDFPGTPRVVPFSFSVDGVGYIGGGDPTNMNFGSTNDFWKYNPETDSWTRLADFPSGNTIGLSGFSLAGVGYVLETGPGNPTAPVAASYSEKLWRYNISADAWEQKASLPTRKFLSGVTFTINDKAYAGLGAVYDWDNTTQKDDFWQYDPVQDTWIKKQDTGGGLRWLGTGFAIGGKGYVGLGTGNTYDAVKDDFWEYTPD